jgi:hypothetical protein
LVRISDEVYKKYPQQFTVLIYCILLFSSDDNDDAYKAAFNKVKAIRHGHVSPSIAKDDNTARHSAGNVPKIEAQ